MISYSIVVMLAVVSATILIAVAYFAYIKGFDAGYDAGWYHGACHARRVLDEGKPK